MKRVIFDTNVLVSAALKYNSPPLRAWLSAVEYCTILASEMTARELADVLNRPKFDRFFSVEKRRAFLIAFENEAQTIPITRTITVCRDPKDNKFLELAVCGAADYLVTGDNDLLALHPFEGVQIVPPATFLAVVAS